MLPSQTKLSQEQLTQLQKDTHFDKKELQQWYKGQFITGISLLRSDAGVTVKAF